MSLRVSVIVAAYHSDASISECLAALRSQTMEAAEIVVVNSSPEDRTRRIVESGFPEVQLVEYPTRLLPHAARNLGARIASGDVLAFTDADCQPAPTWVEQCAKAQQAGHAVVCGSIEPLRSGWFEVGVHLCKYSFRLGTLPAGPSAIAGTANTCYGREIWEHIGPFEGEVYAGDAVLSWRASRAGSPPWFEPRVMVRHRYDHTPMEFWRERRERGEDFLYARARFERWSRARLAVFAGGAFLLPLVPVARAGRDAFRAAWLGRFLWTLPVQLAGHLAWSLGEARAAFTLLRAR